MSKEDLSPEDEAYYERFEVKPRRAVLYVLAVIYLVLVYGVQGSQFSLALLNGVIGTFTLIQGVERSLKKLVFIGGFLTVVSVVLTVSSVL